MGWNPSAKRYTRYKSDVGWYKSQLSRSRAFATESAGPEKDEDYGIPKLSDCYRDEAKKRLASHEVGVIFATQSYPTDTVKKRNRETIDAVVSSKP